MVESSINQPTVGSDHVHPEELEREMLNICLS